MEDKKKACWNCQYYRPLYTKGYIQFDKQNYGFCYRESIVDKHHVCDKWSYNSEFSKKCGRKLRREAALKSLNGILETLTQINQILKEENNKEDEKR